MSMHDIIQCYLAYINIIVLNNNEHTFPCRYNIQCPNETYMLYYSVIHIDIEPPDAIGQCLDFLRTFCCYAIIAITVLDLYCISLDCYYRHTFQCHRNGQ